MALPRNVPIVSEPKQWDEYANLGADADEGLRQLALRLCGGDAAPSRGRYSVYIQGSFGPGVRVHANGQPVGETFGDLGIQDAWQPLGKMTTSRKETSIVLVGLEKSNLRPGSRRYDITGPLAFVREPAARDDQRARRPPRQKPLRQAARLGGAPLAVGARRRSSDLDHPEADEAPVLEFRRPRDRRS